VAYVILTGDPRAEFTGDPPADANNINDVAAGNSPLMFNALNTAYGGGADRTGATDTTAACNDAITAGAGAVTYFPAGTYKLNGSSGLNVTAAGTTLLFDPAAELEIGPSFSAAAAISVTASYCNVLGRPLIRGASSTITSNPAAHGVMLTGAQFCTVDVTGQYVNGHLIESVGGSSLANTGCRFVNPTAYNCAGGVHVKGVTGSGFGGQQWIICPHVSQAGVASGTYANLSCVFIEDCSDIYVVSPDCAVSDAGTGSALHIKGLCSSVFVSGYDLGVFPATVPNNSVLTIEDSANGSPSGIRFGQGILQQGLAGATVSGGASRVYFGGTDFANNSTHGCVLSGTGSGIYFGEDATFRGNGAGASGTNYDLNVSGTATGYVRGAHFLSPVTTTGTAGVQSVVAIAGGQNMPFEDCDFSGTGASLSSIFTNLPTWVRNCRGYNPHGSITVTVPASGSPVATALHYDAIYYITAGASACTVVRNTNGFGGGTGPAVVIPAGQMVPVWIRAGATFTPTYSSAPAWVVDGQ
jgi:hypothetical protein